MADVVVAACISAIVADVVVAACISAIVADVVVAAATMLEQPMVCVSLILPML